MALVLATWTTNVTNAYSGGIAVANLLGLDESKFKITTLITGLVGTFLGAIGIMDRFQGFLSILTSFIPPVAGVIIAQYWIIGKGRKEEFQFCPGIRAAGMISFVAGAAAAYVTDNFVTFFIAPINGIVVSMVLYIVLSKLIPDKK